MLFIQMEENIGTATKDTYQQYKRLQQTAGEMQIYQTGLIYFFMAPTTIVYGIEKIAQQTLASYGNNPELTLTIIRALTITIYGLLEKQCNQLRRQVHTLEQKLSEKK